MNSPHLNKTQGVALIIVLSFVVLVTMTVVAFLSRAELNRKISAVSGGGVQAETIAKGAVDTIVSDLKAEIEAGSDEGSGGALYIPSSDATIYPSRTAGGNIPNLLKISSSDAFHPSTGYSAEGKTRGASTAGITRTTAHQSGNNRVVSKERWAKPRLFADGDNASFPLPHWIYITELGEYGGYTSSGTGSTGWTRLTEADIDDLKVGGDRRAVGRYAYAIYDVGGLLDVNVAGNDLDSISQANVPLNPHRGRLHHADLSDILGEDLSAIVTLRNPDSADKIEELPRSGSLFDPVRTYIGVNAYDPTGTGGGDKEQAFLTRQHLIAYIEGLGADLEVLPHLTIFTRELNKPVWNTTEESSPSLDLSQTVVARMKQRFPLSKIRLLHSDIADPDVMTFFGLVWDNDARHWIYAEGTANGTVVLPRILRLSDISGREPNFFELLKSIINEESLGIPPGSDTAGNHIATGYSSDEKRKDAHIFQLGLNIIDQYDEDRLPTDLFVPLADTSAVNPANRFFGVENLPYLARVAGAFQTENKEDVDGNPITVVHAHLIPEFINPHGTITAGMKDVRLRIIGDATLLIDGTPGAAMKSYGGSFASGGQVVPLKAQFDSSSQKNVWMGGSNSGEPPPPSALPPGMGIEVIRDAQLTLTAGATEMKFAIESGNGAGGTGLSFIMEYNAGTETDEDYRPYAIWHDMKVGSNGNPSGKQLEVTAQINQSTQEVNYQFDPSNAPSWFKKDPRAERVLIERKLDDDLNEIDPTLNELAALRVDRSFRGVGELSYVYRDQLDRNIRFDSADSPDNALLEFFSIYDSTDSSDKLIGGRIALNTRSSVALESMLRGTAKSPTDSGGMVDAEEAKGYAGAIVAENTGNTPIRNRAHLAAVLSDFTGGGSISETMAKQAPARALSDVSNTRTWNLMIDVIAQAGRIPSAATGNVSDRFIVEGERRYWIHIAIDRYTGQEVGSRIIEVVVE